MDTMTEKESKDFAIEYKNHQKLTESEKAKALKELRNKILKK